MEFTENWDLQHILEFQVSEHENVQHFKQSLQVTRLLILFYHLK